MYVQLILCAELQAREESVLHKLYLQVNDHVAVTLQIVLCPRLITNTT